MLLAAFVAPLSVHSSDGGATLHVENYGVDSDTCGREAAPCRTIGRALALARSGDTVLVGPGLYGDLNRDGDLDDPGDEPGFRFLGNVTALFPLSKPVRVISSAGAASTLIDASQVGQQDSNGNPIPITYVDIRGDYVTFGEKDHGFTMQRPGNAVVSLGRFSVVSGNVALNSGSAAFSLRARGFRATDNIARNCYEGFEVIAADQGGLLQNNLAVDNGGYGFTVFGREVVRFNTARGNQTGFRIAGSGAQLEGNLAMDNDLDGYFIFEGQNHVFSRNDAIANGGWGYRIIGGSGMRIVASNIYGNVLNPAPIDPRNDCGVNNASGQTVIARNNFWGAASGPGPDPADPAGPGSGCDEPGSRTVVTPFATRAFGQGE